MLNSQRALSRTDHRPWSLPQQPWVGAQTWNDLLFAHWPVPVDRLRPLVPDVMPIDTYDGRAWVGLVPFWMSGVRARAMPALPWVSVFPELNVRTYVTLEGKPGIFFFSLDAARWHAVLGARAVFRLPYYHARMRASVEGNLVRYASDRTHWGAPPARLRMSYRSVGAAFNPAPGSLEYFLAERYCLFTGDPRGRPIICEIQHPPWPLQSAEADIRTNTMTSTAGIDLPGVAPLLHFVKRQDMVHWLPRPVRG
jgi:uncharacterized protein YqjF (DUF2071 family)